MNYKRRRILLTASAAVLIVLVAVLVGFLAARSLRGASDEEAKEQTSTGGIRIRDEYLLDGSFGEDAQVAEAQRLDGSSMFTNRDLDGSYREADCIRILLADRASQTDDTSAVSIKGDVITIQKEGVYLVSGSLSDGQIVVDADDSDKVQIVLEGVSVRKSGGAAFYGKAADKVFLTLSDGSQNTFSSTDDFADEENNVDGAIFCKSDLTLNGTGTLTVSCEKGHGIVGKDDLVVTGGTYQITSGGGSGLSGKDSVRIADGDFTISAQRDGIHSENDEDEAKGFVYIAGGDFLVSAENPTGGDGIDASFVLQIEGGTFTINSAVGKGMKGKSGIYLSDALADITCGDDALHSDGIIEIESGTYSVSSGDDGVHADSELTIDGGTILISKCYEGLEAETITINGGDIQITSSDDGINAAGKSSMGSMARDGMGGGMGSRTGTLIINGGTTEVTAGGDGIDSNGTFTQTGGALYVSGPTSNGDAAVDWESSGTISGGILIAAGSSGMQETLSSDSKQCSIRLLVSGSAGEAISLLDEDGKELCSYTPSKSYACIVLSCPEIVSDGTYTLVYGSAQEEIVMSGTVYSGSASGSSDGGFGGMGDVPGGGMRQGRP